MDNVQKAGRGFLIIAGAKVWFLITAAAVQLGLPIIFGSAKMFGEFKIITEAVSLINMVVVTGTLQAVSKLVSESPARANQVVWQALKLQMFLGVPLAIGYALASPWIAERFHDPSLTSLMRVSALIIFSYSFYALFVGYFNGMKEFVTQASFDITFATLKTVGILGLVAAGFGVAGAVYGFVGAAVFIMLASAVWTVRILRKAAEATGEPERDREAERDALRRLTRYLILIMIYTFALNGLMRADLFILKSVGGEVPPNLVGHAESVFAVVGSQFAGLYGAALNIARIPYSGVLAVTFIIFPLISEATFADDKEKTREYIHDTFRYCLLFIACIALPLLFNSDSLVAALYSVEYRAASTALSYLSLAIVFFSLFVVATTMVIGAGHPTAALVMMSFSLAVSAVANWFVIRRAHDGLTGSLEWTPMSAAPASSAQQAVAGAIDAGTHQLDLARTFLLAAPSYMEWAAIATMIAMTLGCIVAVGWLSWKFEARPPVKTFLRLIACAAVLFGVDLVFPSPVEWVESYGKIVFVGIVAAKMATMGIVLLASLFVMREFGAEDFDRVRKVIGRKKKA
jgi:O-antigen/teichoic acid export membrane protein